MYFNKSIKYILFVLVTGIFIVQNSFAQNTRFEKLSMDDGLSNNTILTIYQDSRGYIWFGTEDGLNRYDGYTITIFKNNPEDSTTIPGKKVYTIHENNNGNLWLGTDGGLCFFDRYKEKFKTFKNNPELPNSLPSNTVLKILQDPTGDPSTIWLATLDGLSRFNTKRLEFKNYVFKSKNPMNQRFLNMIFSFIPSKKGGFWLGTFKGLLYFDPKKEIYTYHNKIDNFIFSLYEKDTNLIWIGTSSEGLKTYNTETQRINSFADNYNTKEKIENIVISSFLKDKMGHYWIGTSDGIFQVNLDTRNISHYVNSQFRINSLSHNNTKCIFIDKGGILWIGTVNGINKLDFNKNVFIHYYHDPYQEKSLSSNDVVNFHEDKNKNIWIATDNGLNLFYPQTKSFKRFFAIDRYSQNPATGKIMSVIEKNNLIWFGSEAGLFSFNEKKGILKQQFPGSVKLLSNSIYQVFESKSGEFWLATLIGLFKFNPETKSFVHYRHIADDSLSLSHDFVQTIHEDKSGQIWVGTKNGLNKYDPIQDNFIRYFHKKNNPNTICSNNIINIFETKMNQQNELWLGTEDGLCKVIFDDNSNLNCKSFTTADGLSSNKILGITEDRNGFLWILTGNGLSKFDPLSGTIQNFNKNHGLSTNQFNKSIINSTNNMIYIGSTNGLIIFDPSRLKKDSFKPSIAFTKFLNFNQNSIMDSSINEINQIHLPYNDNFFTIGFSALDFSSPLENQFQYKMVGLHDNWINLGNMHEATFTNLDPGNYIFQVKCTNSNGIWNSEMRSIKIYIEPPYWQTWWFISFSIIFGIFSLVGFYKYRTYKIRIHNTELQKEIIERQKAETALSKSEENYREIFNSSSDAIFLHDAETGKILEVNQTMLNMYGYDFNDIQQLTVGDISSNIPPYTPSEAAEWIKKTNEQEQQVFEWQSKRKNGELFWVDVALSKTTIHGENRVLAVVRNIDDRKKVELELEKARNYINNILNSMPSVVIGVDTEISVTHWNKEAENITGITKMQAAGQPLEKVLPQLHNEIERVKKSISSKQLIKENNIPNLLEGKQQYTDLTVYPLFSNGVEGAVIRIDDVTERVRLQEMMIQSEKMLSVGGLAAGMAHEINNPLAGMLQNAQVILNRLTQKMQKNIDVAKECNTTFEAIQSYMEKRKIIEMLEAINITGKRASKIVENMLSFSRKGESKLSSHDVREILDDTIELAASDYDLKKKYDFRKIKIVKEYEENI